jgi:hypothetical protein
MTPPDPPRSTITVDFLTLTRRELDLFDAGYASGYTAGLQRGHDRGGYNAGVLAGWKRRVEHEYAAWRVMAHTIRVMAKADPFTEVAARRRALPPGYQPGPKSYDQCMASWGAPPGGTP